MPEGESIGEEALTALTTKHFGLAGATRPNDRREFGAGRLYISSVSRWAASPRCCSRRRLTTADDPHAAGGEAAIDRA